MTRLPALLMLAAVTALGGSRTPMGGVLRVTQVTDAQGTVDALAALTVSTARELPLCQAVDVTQGATVQLMPRAGISAAAVVQRINTVRSSASPYASMLELARPATGGSDGIALDTPLRGAELEAALCHPMLALAVGSFSGTAESLTANAEIPTGRPWIDSIALTKADARSADRQLSSRKSHLVLGGTGEAGPAFWATVLVGLTESSRSFLAAVPQVLDRRDLTRFFVRPPAEPMLSLQWPAPAEVTPWQPRTPPTLPTKVTLTLAFDATSDDQRAVAERLQVKLGPLGYRVVLTPVAAAELESSRADLVMRSVLLAPSPRVSASILSRLGPADRLLPLYARGLNVQRGPEVKNLHRTAWGLPDLADIFLAGD